jgi:DNA polymerase elongation subunit (family B)
MNIEFQIYDYVEDHEKSLDDEDNKLLGKYIIHCFGRTLDNKSVYAKITDYLPHFYISLPNINSNDDKIIKKNLKKEISILETWLLHKDNKKIYYTYKKTLNDITLVKRKTAEGFTNEKEFYFAKLTFDNNDGMKKISYYLDNKDKELSIPDFNGGKPFKFQLYESNLLQMFRCFHDRKISGCSWVSVSEYKLIKKESKKTSHCNIELIINWKNLNPITKDVNAPLIIASFDIECFSHDGGFPQASRKKDEIIQIGMTYSTLGMSIPYRKWIVCLDKTNDIEGVEVISCDSELELIEKWIDEIINGDCDILTGFNTFYFDEKYIYDRCDKILGMKEEVSNISKLKNRFCNFKEMKLASSALGENLLRIWETPGRVHIDLMKDIQKTEKLDCYKLDYIASNYIKGNINSFNILEDNKIELLCNEVNDIQLEDFIHINISKGFISDEIGYKYNVININKEEKKLIIKSDKKLLDDLQEIDKNDKLFWSQAKDDVSPQDIFRMQKEGPKERAIIAKYCIKDCSLCNLLINKLEVVTKNIEMSNVCWIPLSYLFTRGQGIKIFSLTLKDFKQFGYVFPVIKVKRNDDGEIDKEDSFEGAIVFDPVSQINYEACSTLDFNSLYPSVDIHFNGSHETKVIDDNYDNIEGITYYNTSYKESDGSIKYVRYAKKGDNLGVIPTILSNLLKERKVVKKLMKNEKDKFKYSILDAKQLALKVTANSLYGQLGASTSQIANRDIAACITSTGRVMLLYAKNYEENVLPLIINGLKEAYKNNNIDNIDKIFKTEIKDQQNEEIKKTLESFTKETIKDIIIQPVVRYGDTDSVFTCFRLRENTELVLEKQSLNLLKQVFKFGYELINPFFKINEQILFTEYYNKYKITDLELPRCNSSNNNIFNDFCFFANKDLIKVSKEERMIEFVKEYIENNYLSWLWTLQEIIEKDTDNINIKLFDWALYLLQKYKFDYNDLEINRINEIVIPFIEYINNIYKDGWNEPTNENIEEFIKLINIIFINEIKKPKNELVKQTKKFFSETLKEEWITAKNKHDMNATKIKKNLKREKEYNNKELKELIITFIEKNLKLDFNKYKNEHIDKLKDFMNVIKDIYIQPYRDYEDENKIIKIKFYKNGSSITDKRTVELSIKLGEISGELVKSKLPFPHNLEYEKTFWPFLILSKKRYVGNKYEFDPNKYKFDFMGIVLKRRDNAPIVKEICSSIIDFLINKRDPNGAKMYAEKCFDDMFNNKYDIKYFCISKTLKQKESYKDWKKIAHVYLSEQIALRDAGNKPQSGDRLEYAYVIPPNLNPKKKVLQGEIIETPSYIKEKNIPLNYMHYLENQIMLPSLQFLKLVDKNAENIFINFKKKYNKNNIDNLIENLNNLKITENSNTENSNTENTNSKTDTNTNSDDLLNIPVKKSKKPTKNI